MNSDRVALVARRSRAGFQYLDTSICLNFADISLARSPIVLKTLASSFVVLHVWAWIASSVPSNQGLEKWLARRAGAAEFWSSILLCPAGESRSNLAALRARGTWKFG